VCVTSFLAPALGYLAGWCGDCVRAKKFFADNHVDYLWIDLEEDEVELN
jgi:hypothetical protein